MKKIFTAALIAVSLTAAVSAQQITIKGFLVDRLCGEAGYPESYEGKIDLTVTPERNVVACLTMDNCAATGFGIYVQGSGDRYVFHPFDGVSSAFVKRQIVDKLRAKGDPAPYIEVAGRASATGVISGVTKAALARRPPAGGKPASEGMSGHNM